ncbi:MAG: hypothetical protein HUJ26_13495 [Planctomycetaceae bacterium]|nr:hypothetical protein [Planctomycetaceae bacterium]
MTKQTRITTLMVVIAIVSGCQSNENQRLAEMAERQLDRQAEQNQRMADLQEEVAEGSKRLVEADAEARREMIGLHHDLQTERQTVGQQRDHLEQDRRELAAQRHRDPIIAETIQQIGLLIACGLPLLICLMLLRQPVEPSGDREIAELLIADLVSAQPQLLQGPDDSAPRLSQEASEPHQRLTQAPDDEGTSESD